MSDQKMRETFDVIDVRAIDNKPLLLRTYAELGERVPVAYMKPDNADDIRKPGDIPFKGWIPLYTELVISEAALREALHPHDFDHFKFAGVVKALRKLGVGVQP